MSEDQNSASRTTISEDAWLCGYAACVAALVRLFDRPTMARDIAKADGLDLAAFGAAGVEDSDLQEIKKALAA